jgi:GDP/UDP-N,N'-diacetylbacillosamine 2-epimerase (hydrolysing)
MKKHKIIAITGIRSEYELLFPVLSEINKKKNLEVNVIATGAHNSSNFGNTIDEIRKDGFNIVGVVENLLNSNTLTGRAKSAGILLAGLPEILSKAEPDLVLALGDREEPLISAIACNYLNIPFAHIAGGDRALPQGGDVDEGIRHATTKLAHLHFTMMQEHTDRILKMGEEKWRVFTVGNPGLDRIRETKIINKSELGGRIGINLSQRKNIVVIQHVIHQESNYARSQMECTLNSLSQVDANIIIIYPNSDAGSLELIQVINEYVKDKKHFYAFKNLPRLDFINLLRCADLLIGNSSAGILEAPFLKLPTINVGERQKERLHSSNVVFIPFNEKEIIAGIKTALFDDEFKERVKKCKSIYGDGYAGKHIADILSDQIKYDKKLLAKDITY